MVKKADTEFPRCQLRFVSSIMIQAADQPLRTSSAISSARARSSGPRSYRRLPASVKPRTRFPRSIRLTPSSASSEDTARLTVEWLTNILRPAAVKLFVRATSRKALNCSSSISIIKCMRHELTQAVAHVASVGSGGKHLNVAVRVELR